MYIEYLFIFVILVLSVFPLKKRAIVDSFFTKESSLVIRGISAVFVFTSHFQIWMDAFLERKTPRLVQFSVGQLGGIGVLLFFFVSGYGIMETYGRKEISKDYFSKRFWGVFFPYVLIKILLLVISYCFSFSRENFWHEFWVIFSIPDWFVFVILLQYIAFYFAHKLLPKYVIILSVIFDILFTIWFVIEDKPIGWFNALWLFTFGLVVSKYKKVFWNLFSKNRGHFLAILCLGFVICGFLFAIYKGSSWANFVKPLSGIFLSLLCVALLNKVEVTSILARWAGTRSLYIYIIHISVWDYTYMIKAMPLRFLVSMLLTGLLTEIIYRIVSALLILFKGRVMRSV